MRTIRRRRAGYAKESGLGRAPQRRGKTYQRRSDEQHRGFLAETMSLDRERKRTQIPRHDVSLTSQLDFKRCATPKGRRIGNALPIFVHRRRLFASVEVRVLNDVGIRMDTSAFLTPINTL